VYKFTQLQHHIRPYPLGSPSVPSLLCGMTDYGETYPFLYSQKAVWARIRIRARKKQENSWELDGFEYCRQGQILLAFVKTKRLVVSSTRLVSAYRQYLRQQRALRHKIVLINCSKRRPLLPHSISKREVLTPISLVTHPSLHPTSKTRAPLNNPRGRTESRWSFRKGRFV